jgi:HEAT repeat protein
MWYQIIMAQADLASQIWALNERLRDAYLAELESESPLRRKRAARALAKLGRSGAAAIPALRAALKDRDRKVREAALFALKQLGDEEGEVG